MRSARTRQSFLCQVLHERPRLSLVACVTCAQFHFLFATHPIYPNKIRPSRPLGITDIQLLHRPLDRLPPCSPLSGLHHRHKSPSYLISTAMHHLRSASDTTLGGDAMARGINAPGQSSSSGKAHQEGRGNNCTASAT